MSDPVSFGLIADPAAQVEPALRNLFSGVSHILIAGDIADPDRIERLEELAPVIAIRGDDDDHEGLEDLPRRALVRVAGWRVLIIHHPDDPDLEQQLQLSRPDLLILGRSDKPGAAWRDDVLVVSPGSASAGHGAARRTAAVLELKPDEGPVITLWDLEADASYR